MPTMPMPLLLLSIRQPTFPRAGPNLDLSLQRFMRSREGSAFSPGDAGRGERDWKEGAKVVSCISCKFSICRGCGVQCV
jgi:hypothetical protein